MQTTDRLRITLREPTEDERAAWQKYIDQHARYTARSYPPPKESLAGRILSLVFITGAIAWFVWYRWGLLPSLIIIAVGLLIAVFQPGAFCNRLRERQAAIAELDQARASLAKNIVEVMDVRPLGLVIGEEWADLGDNFFFDIGDKTILCLRGQWCHGGGLHRVYLLREQFTLVRAPGDWFPFYASSSGAELKASRTIAAEEIAKLRLNGEISTFPGSLGTLEYDLRVHAEDVNRRS